MKYYTSTTEYNCGIDLHARLMYVCLMDRQRKKLVQTNVKDSHRFLLNQSLTSLASSMDENANST